MADRSVQWNHVVTSADAITFRAGRQGDGLVAEWPGLARVTCALDGSRSRVTPAAGAPRRSLEKLRGFVRALLSERRGGLGLHGSAVALGSRAILFTGGSGVGKSTAAAELCRERGAEMLADDAALLEIRDGVIHVVPSEGVLYLSRESRAGLGLRTPGSGPSSQAGKLRTRPATVGTIGYPLALVVGLRFDDTLHEATWRRMRGHEAVGRLLDGMIRFDLSDDEARLRELDQVARVCDQATVAELARPTRAPKVGRLVVEALEGRGR